MNAYVFIGGAMRDGWKLQDDDRRLGPSFVLGQEGRGSQSFARLSLDRSQPAKIYGDLVLDCEIRMVTPAAGVSRTTWTLAAPSAESNHILVRVCTRTITVAAGNPNVVVRGYGADRNDGSGRWVDVIFEMSPGDALRVRDDEGCFAIWIDTRGRAQTMPWSDYVLRHG